MMFWIIPSFLGIVAGYLLAYSAENMVAWMLAAASVASSYLVAKEFAMRANATLHSKLKDMRTEIIELREELIKKEKQRRELEEKNAWLSEELNKVREKLAESGDNVKVLEYLIEKATESPLEDDEYINGKGG